MKKRSVGMAIIAGVILAACVLGIAAWVLSTTLPVHTSNNPSVTPTPTPEPDHGINTLLLGYAGGKHDGTYLTDTIMILRVDPETKQSYLLSVPRDLWVSIPITPGGKEAKINAAYAYGLDEEQFPSRDSSYKGQAGALTLVKDVITATTGLRIDHTVAADFSGFSRAIDQLGGVDIYNPITFEDKEYPIEGKETDLCGKDEAQGLEELKTATSAAIVFPCRYETISFQKGTIHVNGTEALKYVRSRHSTQYGSDFSRSQRQRTLLLAVKDKVLSLGSIAKLPDLFKTFSTYIHTDISVSDVAGLIPSLSEWSSYPITTVGLSDANILTQVTMKDGQMALTPLDGTLQTSLIKTYIWDSVHPERPKKAPVTMLEGTRSQTVELAFFQKMLSTRGIPVPDITYVETPATQSAVLLRGKMAPSVIETLRNSIVGLQFETVEKLPGTIDVLLRLAPEATVPGIMK